MQLIKNDIDNVRADVCLASALNQSRSSLLALFEQGKIKLNNKSIKAGHKLKIGDEIECEFSQTSKLEQPKYEVDFDISILYEDEDLLVINKPINVATHGCASLKQASVVEWLQQNNYMLSNLAGEQRAGIVHRLDKPTSGTLIIAKHNKAHAALSQMIAAKQINRIYLAICNLGCEQICERYIARAPHNRLKMRSLSKEQALKLYGDNEAKWGRYSKTQFINVDELATASFGQLIAAKLYTGRTHQIRSHLASLNRFIYGDELYAPDKIAKAERLMLHSFTISFTHPFTQAFLNIYAPLDGSFKNSIYFRKDIDEKAFANLLMQRFSI